MTKKLVRTILPVAPSEYDQNYVNQLARSLESLIDEVRSTSVNIQGIQGSGAVNTFEQGDLYIGDGGFLRVARDDDIFSGSVQGTMGIGTVIISVS